MTIPQIIAASLLACIFYLSLIRYLIWCVKAAQPKSPTDH